MSHGNLRLAGSRVWPGRAGNGAPAAAKTGARTAAPQRYKMAVLTWFVVYPMITLLLAVLDPVLGTLPMPVRTLVLTLIMVPAMVYVAMPFATARFRAWLTGAASLAATREGKTDV